MVDTPRLARRPEARAFSVESLLQLAIDGKLRIPEFQRPQRWRSTHVLSLFDSVARGFPIGPLLFSRQKAPVVSLKFGPVAIAAPAVDEAMFVVDGQQRLTALVGAMLHPDARPRGDIHAIWYDLEAEKFQRLEVSDPPPHWIPLNVVGDSKKLMRWLRAWPLSSERQDLEERAFELSKALREYQAPAYIVEGADDKVLRLIFKRVNTAGVGMREEEVFEALHGRGQSAKAACARLESLQWGALTEEDVIDALKSVTGIDPRERFRDGERVPSLPDDAMDRTEAALRRAISFLRDAAEIPHVTLLPYRLPLRILARFFAIHPNPPPRVELLLVRWVWRGALSGQHADNGDVVVDRLQKAIGADPHLAVADLLANTTQAIEMPSVLDRWNGRYAKTRLCALGMLHLHPRDPTSGDALLRGSIEARLEMFVTRARTAPVGRRIGLGTRSVPAERTPDSGPKVVAEYFLVRRREDLKRLFGTALLGSSAPPEVLASHGLDTAAIASLHAGDVAGFVRQRAALLDPKIHQFFTERAAPGQSDRPAISAIILRAGGASS